MSEKTIVLCETADGVTEHEASMQLFLDIAHDNGSLSHLEIEDRIANFCPVFGRGSKWERKRS